MVIWQHLSIDESWWESTVSQGVKILYLWIGASFSPCQFIIW